MLFSTIPQEEAEIREVLRRAGWYPGRDESVMAEAWSRRIDKPGGFSIFKAAHDVIASFGGLNVEVSGPGRECARTPFEVDPTLAIDEEDRFLEASASLRTRLYPLGEIGHGYSFLSISENGSIYFIGDVCALAGKSMADAIRSMIIGYRAVSVPCSSY